MNYATVDDMVGRFEADEINDLDPGEDRPRTSIALTDASHEIDSALAAVYALPLAAPAPPVLVGIACDLARARLYDEIPPDNVVRRVQSARKRLREIVEGERRLVAEDGTVVPRLGSVSSAAANQPERVFTEKTLEGY